MSVEKLGFNINDWVVDTIERLERIQDRIAALEERISALENGWDVWWNEIESTASLIQ